MTWSRKVTRWLQHIWQEGGGRGLRALAFMSQSPTKLESQALVCINTLSRWARVFLKEQRHWYLSGCKCGGWATLFLFGTTFQGTMQISGGQVEQLIQFFPLYTWLASIYPHTLLSRDGKTRQLWLSQFFIFPLPPASRFLCRGTKRGAFFVLAHLCYRREPTPWPHHPPAYLGWQHFCCLLRTTCYKLPPEAYFP